MTDIVRFQPFSYFAQRSFRWHRPISGLMQQDVTSNIFYHPTSINFNKQMFA